MSVVDLPLPVVAVRGVTRVDVGALQSDLVARVDGEVRFDAGARAAYSTDASNDRQIPVGLVPRTVDAVVDAVVIGG
jgi:hypothetical protein